MDATTILEFLNKYWNLFVVFNKNAFYYILYFMRNYYMYLFVVAAIGLMCFYEIKALDEKYIDDGRRIV